MTAGDLLVAGWRCASTRGHIVGTLCSRRSGYSIWILFACLRCTTSHIPVALGETSLFSFLRPCLLRPCLFVRCLSLRFSRAMPNGFHLPMFGGNLLVQHTFADCPVSLSTDAEGLSVSLKRNLMDVCAGSPALGQCRLRMFLCQSVTHGASDIERNSV